MNEFANDYILFKVDEEQIECLAKEKSIDFWATFKNLADYWRCEIVKEQEWYKLKNDPNRYGTAGVAILKMLEQKILQPCFSECHSYDRGNYDADVLKWFKSKYGG